MFKTVIVVLLLFVEDCDCCTVVCTYLSCVYEFR